MESGTYNYYNITDSTIINKVIKLIDKNLSV